MSKVLLGCLTILLLLAAGLVFLSVGHDVAAQSVPRNCRNALNDDAPDDAVVNDGCPQVGAIDEEGDWCGGGSGDTVNQDANDDTVADDGCPGGPAASGQISEAGNHCANAVNDDPANDTYVNDGCPVAGAVDESILPVGGIAQLPDVGGDSGSLAGTYAALAGGLAAAVVILSAGAWYARRRWVK